MKSRKVMPQDAPDLSRRRFIVAGATVSGTFLLGIPLTAALAEDNPPDGDGRIGFYIHILENGFERTALQGRIGRIVPVHLRIIHSFFH